MLRTVSSRYIVSLAHLARTYLSFAAPTGREQTARARNAARIAQASGDWHKSDTSGSRRRRQFGRSLSVPGRLIATVSPARSSAWTKASKDGVADTKAWMATATAGGIGW